MELWDAYDGQGNKIGGELIRGQEISEGCYHLVSEVVVNGNDLNCVGETFESRIEGLCMVAFTRFPALDGGFRKKVKAVKDVVL